MTGLIQTYAKWRNLVILIVTIILINILLAFTLGQNPEFKPLDLQFCYTPVEAYARVSGYTDYVRSMYVLMELTLDILYPVIYSVALCCALFLFYRRPKLAQLPLLLIILDWIENGFIVFILISYPKKRDWLVQMASLFTSLKWTLIAICVILLLSGAVRLLFKGKDKNTRTDI
jgi:hypothetical protein